MCACVPTGTHQCVYLKWASEFSVQHTMHSISDAFPQIASEWMETLPKK
jgi:hypothetical protein